MVPASVFGPPTRPAPADRVNIALIGCGGQGNYDMDRHLKLPGAQIGAVCDVDAGNMEGTKEQLEDFYAKQRESDYKGCFASRDYREICSRKDVDAVIV